MCCKNFIRWVYILSVVLLQSCYTGGTITYLIPEPRQKENFYYTPSTSNPPLLTNKNDISFSYNYSTASNYTSSEFMAAYMPAEHIGISANINHRFGSHETIFPRWEVGAGYVKPLSSSWHFQTYAGFGTGHIENNHATGISTFNTKHIYLEPALIIHNQRNTVQFAFVSRFTQIHYNLSDTSFKADRERYTEAQVYTLINHPNHLFWEPGIMFKFGWQHVLFNLNYTISKHIGSNDFDRVKNNVSVGLALKLNSGKSEKKVHY